MNTQDRVGKAQVERIKKALRALEYTDVEIAGLLLKFEVTIHSEVGTDLLETLPEDKQKEVEKLIEEKKMKEVKAYFSGVSKEDYNRRLEEKLETIAQELEKAVEEADKTDKALDKFAQVLTTSGTSDTQDEPHEPLHVPSPQEPQTEGDLPQQTSETSDKEQHVEDQPISSSRPDPTPAIHALRDAGYETEASQLEAASRDENFDTSWLFGNGTLSSPDRIRMLMQSETIGKQLESSRNKAQGAPDQPENKEGKDSQKPTVLNNLFNSFRRN